ERRRRVVRGLSGRRGLCDGGTCRGGSFSGRLLLLFSVDVRRRAQGGQIVVGPHLLVARLFHLLRGRGLTCRVLLGACKWRQGEEPGGGKQYSNRFLVSHIEPILCSSFARVPLLQRYPSSGAPQINPCKASHDRTGFCMTAASAPG